MNTLHALTFAIVPSLFLACASTPGAKPHDMSAAQHDGMAQREDQTAAGHVSQYDAKAVSPAHRCQSARVTAGEPCWTGDDNPTAEHVEDAKKHEKMAADHRAASQALRDAEARACAGLSNENRDLSPFDRREDVASVDALRTSPGPKTGGHLEGAIVTFRAVPGLTTEWLQRVVDCHLARNDALGHDAREMPSCPLVPKGVSARVSSTGNGFAVAIRAEDAETAREVLRRAQTLVAAK